ncbi:Holliday junction branch migration protein RuvA, partial [Candidatus Aerophobetes bacterium]|nr:Holliday junction branch migration protein RuvA [Candidatus Aerophobetes bacterium]
KKPSLEDKTAKDAVSALVSLGYTKSQAEEAVKKALQEKKDIKKDIAALIKESLKHV